MLITLLMLTAYYVNHTPYDDSYYVDRIPYGQPTVLIILLMLITFLTLITS